jgi:hypothetical protein
MSRDLPLFGSVETIQARYQSHLVTLSAAKGLS